MRITIRLDDDLAAEAKRRAARSRTTLSAIIAHALRESFNRPPSGAMPGEVELSTWRHGWLRPGVDLDDGASTLDLMEREISPF
jgi:hypothetical protein